ncbi:MAG TPA: PLP-dependent aminotransferase family protein [bacterium]|nr:PLP-dependent aminotransferase family protein [bacterium]HPQ66801.1 PLP-dependent aminotransferase family protein [bacterium]
MKQPQEENVFADRIRDVPRSFIREILKVALDPEVISFAGGLPNRALFPVEALKAAAARVFDEQGRDVLQYGNSEGDPRLREYISDRYREKMGLDIPVESILITSGSQQGLDLLGKTLLNEGDAVVIEEPGYLGTIQAFSLYRPEFLPVPVSEEGMDPEGLRAALAHRRPKLLYAVPNFQNPSGISYSEENRRALAEVLAGTRTFLVEDDPYGDLRYEGEPKPSFRKLLPGNTVLLGSFSKIVAPGFRLGWIAAPPDLMHKLITAKQATDLHTTHLIQGIVYRYLRDNDLDEHIRTIREVYGRQCRAMKESIKKHLPPEVGHTHPEGGMFLWAELPGRMSALELFEVAVKDKVVFVPGDPFYVAKTGTNTMRLNFSCVDEATIDRGMQRLGRAIRELSGGE